MKALALLLLATTVLADKFGLAEKDAKFFERVREVAAEGATVKRARAFRDEYAKQPEPDLLRGLGWLPRDAPRGPWIFGWVRMIRRWPAPTTSRGHAAGCAITPSA